MGKRYVFWRAPDGKPYKGNDGKHAPSAILAEMGRAAHVPGPDKVEWRGFNVSQLEPALRSAAVVVGPDGRELNEVDAWSIVRPSIAGVIQQLGGGKPAVPADVIREADVKAAAFFRKETTPYNLVASLSLKSFPAGRITVRGCSVTPLRSSSRLKFPQVLERHSKFFNLAQEVHPEGYQLVRVRTSGRTLNEATARAHEALGLLRGLWTLFATYGSWSISVGSPRPKPVGNIQLGPTRTLHHLNGQPADDAYWHDPDIVITEKMFEPTDGWTHTEKARRWAMNRIGRLTFRQEVEDLIIRYAVALDHANLDVAMLQMWSLLEKVTDTVGSGYDHTVLRAIWFWKDRRLAKEQLEALRVRRNLYVHGARTSERRDQLVYSIKTFVDAHLIGVIRNDFAADSLEEYGRFLSLPADLQELERRSRGLARAVRIVKKWSKPHE